MDKAVQWNLGIELVKEGAKTMRYIRVLQDRASTVVRVLEDDFEERVLYWLRGRQPANDNIEGGHLARRHFVPPWRVAHRTVLPGDN